MKWHRVRTILLHSYYHFFHSKETWIDLIWFTSIQFIIFGFIAHFFAASNPEIAQNLLLGFLFWETVRIGQYCISVGILWDVWSRSLSSLFITPLTMGEMLTGQSVSAFVKSIIVICGLSLIGMFFFQFSVLAIGPILIVDLLILLLFSVATGTFIFGLILRFGTDIQSLAWGLIYILQPISAVFYPVEALPVQIRWLAYISPITFVMEAARAQLHTHQPYWSYLGIGFVLTLVYFYLSLLFLKRMFYWSRKTGSFARLGN
jgi:ABC-2 type transport system permease protein